LEIFNYDSTLQDLHIAHPAFRQTANNSYLGNMGTATNSNIFAEPNPKTGFILMESFTPYMFHSNNMTYYNVTTPFTLFKVDIGPLEEQDLDILHTQNINPFFNFHIRFRNYSGQGIYIRQKTRNNAGTIGGVYTKGRLATHVNWVFNRIDVEENGGVIDDSLIVETILQPSEISMRLTNGSNFIKDRQLYFDQKIGFLKTNVPDSSELGNYWFSLQYTFNRHKSSKVYKDTDDSYVNNYGDTMNLYKNTYNGGATFDSTYYFYSNHNFRLNLEENPRSYPFVGAYFGYGIEGNDYYYFNKDSGFVNSADKTTNSAYFEAGMYRLKGEKFKFSGNYKLFISGYRASNMQLDGFVSHKFGRNNKTVVLKGEGILSLNTPDYLLTRYYSNHYRWDNSFNSEKKTRLHFSLSSKYYKTKLGSRFNILGDYIYFNNEGLPTQHNTPLSVLDVYLNNTFNFGPFGLYTRINYQNTTNSEVLPLPDLSGYAALYWGPTIHFKSTGGKLRFNAGADVYYWSSYYGPAYSPALARFHNQNQKEIGNYPFVGLFWNFEIKRLRFYLRFEHASYGIVEPTKYFLAPNYPSNRNAFRYGIIWSFYD
jgi:hypothetical protein